jgi:hypothetical protein
MSDLMIFTENFLLYFAATMVCFYVFSLVLEGLNTCWGEFENE